MSHDDNRRIVRAYSWVAWIYGLWTWFTEHRSLGAALEPAHIRDGEAVLEVAVGTGELFQQILRKNPSGRNVGVDLTPAMLRRARDKAESTHVRHELIEGDARSLPFPNESFDLVINNNMLGLVPAGAVGPILTELRRVLRPGGKLILVMMRKPSVWPARVLFTIGAVKLGRWRDLDLEPSLAALGFEVVRRLRVVQFGVPSDIFEMRRP